LVEVENYKYSDFYVLFRINRSGSSFERVAIREGVPLKLLRGSLLDRKEIQYLLNLIRLSHNAVHGDSTDAILDSYLFPLAKELAPDIAKKTYKTLYKSKEGGTILEKLKSIAELDVKGIGDKRKKSFIVFYTVIDEAIKAYQRYLEDKDLEKLMGFYQEIILKFKFAKKANIFRFDDIKETISDFTHILNEFEGDLIDRVNKVLIDFTVDDIDNEDRVLGMTVHKAKGLENKVVFIIDVNAFPMPKSDDLQEEKRLLYVASTRAEERLYMTYNPDPYFGEFDGATLFDGFEFIDTNIDFKVMKEQMMESLSV